MRIGDLSEKTGVSRATIRFYERNGLVTSVPGTSSTNDYRNYPEENVGLLNFLTKARDAGMSIADLKDLMDAFGNNCDKASAEKIVSDKVVELKDRVAHIQLVIHFLEEQLNRANSEPGENL